MPWKQNAILGARRKGRRGFDVSDLPDWNHSVLGAYAKVLAGSGPDRIVGLANALEPRIRATRLRTPDQMAELRVWAREMSQSDYGKNAKESTQFMIIKEGKTIPEAGIEFDVPDKDASRMTKAILGQCGGCM